jgi:hypothetical protein
VAYEEKTVEQIVEKVVDFSVPILKEKVFKFVLSKITGIFSPFWIKITLWILDWVFNNWIIPALEDWEQEGFCFIRTQERKKRVKVYLEAPDENFDESVDDFFDAPSVHK